MKPWTVILWPAEEGGFVVRCPDLEGCISQGETREQALANIEEAIHLCLETQDDDLEPSIPPEAELLQVPGMLESIEEGRRIPLEQLSEEPGW